MQRQYPTLNVNLDILRANAKAMCRLCADRGVDVAGVIKLSDGDLQIARAYADGGCRQIASSRTVHLERIKKAMPDLQTMLIRIPMASEIENVVRWCDLSLNSEESILRLLDREAERQGKTHGVVLMQDVGDRREGIFGRERLLDAALLVEHELEHLRLAGVGASFACVSGVRPDWDNLSELAESAEPIEKAIGRKLDIVSGGSSISLTLLAAGKPIPEKINHVRIGGAIANPMGMRENRGVTIEGLREDAFTLTAEIVEVGEKPSAPGGPRKNWSGQIVEFEDRGVRKRAIAALGSQDIGNAMQLIPLEKGVSVLAGSSDHTVLDVTDSEREWAPGDLIDFRMYYMPMLYCFATRHVQVEYSGRQWKGYCSYGSK